MSKNDPRYALLSIAPGRSCVENLVAREVPTGGDSEPVEHWLLPRRNYGLVCTDQDAIWLANLRLLGPSKISDLAKSYGKREGFQRFSVF